MFIFVSAFCVATAAAAAMSVRRALRKTTAIAIARDVSSLCSCAAHTHACTHAHTQRLA